jgi:hypothetical protein
MTVTNYTSTDAPLAASLARMWPHREHESNALTGLLCRCGLHRWRMLDQGEFASGKDVRFCFWCSVVRIDGRVIEP